jgi:hypothetical protein
MTGQISGDFEEISRGVAEFVYSSCYEVDGAKAVAWGWHVLHLVRELGFE